MTCIYTIVGAVFANLNLLQSAEAIVLNQSSTVVSSVPSVNPVAANAPTSETLVLDFEGIDSLKNYGGLNWQDFGLIDRENQPDNSGLSNGIRGGQAALRPIGSNVNPIVNSNDGAFTFNGTYLTAAWSNGLQIEIQGFFEGQLIPEFSTTITTNIETQTFAELNWEGVDELRFNSFGGVDIEAPRFNRKAFVVDDFTITRTRSPQPVPEPLTAVGSVLALGIGMMTLRSRSQKSADQDNDSNL
ncbi:MAG: PEP-CTERM sorting domain-containing protein [Microcoleaceae cyanobacterium]